MLISAALTLPGSKTFEIADVEIESPREDEVLVRLTATGVCHTDMVMRDQALPTPLPAVLGHEGAGIVVQAGRASGLKEGDAVVLTFNSCASCPSCRAAAPSYCHDFFGRNFLGRRPDGTSGLSWKGKEISGNIFGQSSFATHALAHGVNAVKVRDDAPLELLGPLGCGVMTGAGTALKALNIRAGASVAVLGAGAVGCSAIIGARIAGAGEIIAVDLAQHRLDLAGALGATRLILAPDDSLAALASREGFGGVDYIIDTTGSGQVVIAAAAALAPRGVLALVGAYPPTARLELEMAYLMSAGRSVQGVVEGGADPQRFIPELVDHLMEGRLPLERLVRFFPFSQINAAVEASESGAVIKPVLLFS